MSNDIRIKKGLDISLVGMAAKSISTAIKSNYYALRPEDFHGVTPKLTVKLGDKVNAGDPIFFDKSNDCQTIYGNLRLLLQTLNGYELRFGIDFLAL